jgi:hypothetical protein
VRFAKLHRVRAGHLCAFERRRFSTRLPLVSRILNVPAVAANRCTPRAAKPGFDPPERREFPLTQARIPHLII